MGAALAFLILITLTNYALIFFSCHGLHNYGAWLSKYHKVDLWLQRVLVGTLWRLNCKARVCLFTCGNVVCVNEPLLLSRLQVQNGIAIYATWTTIASLVNLSIVLNYDANVSPADAATASLSILTVLLVVWCVESGQLFRSL